MIARFIYTDCRSDGPYTTGVAKKYKSVVIPGAFAAGAPSIASLADRLPKNSLTMGYQIEPTLDSITTAEFKALPKSWAFAQIGEDTFGFVRVATAGKCYGRDNRFDEGFVFSWDSWPEIVEAMRPVTKKLNVRPVDFVHSAGWLNPRGELELEAAILDSGFYQLDANFREQLRLDLGAVKGLNNLKSLLTGFAHSQLTGGPAFVPKGQKQNFFAIVSVFTRLTALDFAWQTGFSDIWSAPRSRELADGHNPHFLLGEQTGTLPTSLAVAWANLATEAFSSGIIGKLVQKIDELCTECFSFDRNNREQGLSVLPLAVLLTDKADLVGRENLARLAADFIEQVALPESWKTGAQEKTLDSAANAVYRGALNSESIESKLTNIGGTP